MSIREMSRVWEDSKQSGNRLLLLLAIADFANDDGYCWPNIPTLAKKTRMSERTVMRAISELVKDDELYAFRARNIGNKYIVLAGCNKRERDRRIKTISDKLSSNVTDCHLISDIAVSLDPSRSIKEPSLVSENGSTWIFSLYTDIFKETVTSGEHDDLRELASVYVQADVKEAMKITKSKNDKRRIARKIAYTKCILEDWAANGKPEIVKKNEGTPIKPKKVYR